MHIWLSLYYVLYIILFSTNSYNSFCLAVLFILLQYFKYLSQLLVYERGPYQFCTSCSKMTLQHYVHCNACRKCVPVAWSHSKLLNGCSTEFHISRYQYLIHILNIYIAILLALYGLVNYFYFCILLIHLYAIYKTLKEKNINITTLI